MDKKDIYEHLAKIYLDASQKRKKKSKKFLQLKNILLIILSFSIGFGVFFVTVSPKKRICPAGKFLLVLQPDIAKINFNFDPACKEIYTINLNNLDLAKYNALSFAVKKTNYFDTISMKVELVNSFNEKSEVYLRDIPNKWQNYELSFNEFKKINDWAQMKELSFIVEEWNTKEKNGIVYIDNVGLVR